MLANQIPPRVMSRLYILIKAVPLKMHHHTAVGYNGKTASECPEACFLKKIKIN